MRKAIILPVHPLLSPRLLLAETHPAISRGQEEYPNPDALFTFYATSYYIDEHE